MKERATVVCWAGSWVLLVTRERGRWSLPGGTLKREESPPAAARRELWEETSVDASQMTYLFTFGGLNKQHHVFEVRLDRDTRVAPANEIRQCRWFHHSAVGQLNTSIPTKQIVELAFRAMRHSTVRKS
ncbi:NUDIX hydrolase [Pandoraea sputorum]|uniref:NUDIX hydrolase n=1 Tax=Pandoraea sputorum TaxID=93222 RepID=UPI001241E132|nr:NUDIX domain-containing protein [Pandoraea sputorum]